MRLFSKIVFLCNICFIISMVLRTVELGMKKNGNPNSVIPLQPIEGSIVVLGVVAILLNAAFAFIILYRKSIRKTFVVHGFILWFNLLLLPVQIWYHFISG